MSQSVLPKAVERLARALGDLPGIGPKTANRLTFFLLAQNQGDLAEFGAALTTLKDNLITCSICQIISETDPCPICANDSRDQRILAVVEEPLDVIAIERARFTGRYHVLGGQISPINNVAASDLTIKELLTRLGSEKIEEVILATNPSLEGEATAIYIDERIQEQKRSGSIPETVKVSRLARGLPVGGDLEYADELTLTRAIEGRRGLTTQVETIGKKH